MKRLIYSKSLIVALLLLSACHKKLSYYEVNCTKHTYFRIQYAHTKPVPKEINEVIETYYNSLHDSTNTFVENDILCDLLSAHFDKKGIDNYIIDVGGKIVMKGVNHYKRPWIVGIPTPDDRFNRRTFHYASNRKKRAIVTAGDYKHAHARIRLANKPPILSVTVVADNCKRAKALSSTILFMPKDTFAFHKNRFNLTDYLLVYSNDTDQYVIETSEGIRRYTDTPDPLVYLQSDQTSAFELGFQTEPVFLPPSTLSFNPALPPSR